MAMVWLWPWQRPKERETTAEPRPSAKAVREVAHAHEVAESTRQRIRLVEARLDAMRPRAAGN